MKGADVVAAARAWLGTPFQHQARVRGVGVDCIGLVLCVGRELGAFEADFNYDGYDRLPHDEKMLIEARQHLLEIPLAEITPGCILMMQWGREPQHVAIYAGDTIIHAATSFRAVVEHRYAGKWPQRVHHAFQLPGVSHG